MTAAGPNTDPTSPADPATLRRSYVAGRLTEDDLAGDWLTQLRHWYADAAADDRIAEPNAMQLATADSQGRPDVRTVLARGFDDAGVVFYTNYTSAKGRQLQDNPVAAGVFSWLPAERQIRFRGPVDRVGPDETAEYFAGRPRGAQLGAWASPQSDVIPGRGDLDRALAEVTARFGDDPIGVPPFWGGFRITVTEIEFWQGREFRLHDRLRFRLTDGDWAVERLAP